jgi:hypothetical protein
MGEGRGGRALPRLRPAGAGVVGEAVEVVGCCAGGRPYPAAQRQTPWMGRVSTLSPEQRVQVWVALLWPPLRRLDDDPFFTSVQAEQPGMRVAATQAAPVIELGCDEPLLLFLLVAVEVVREEVVREVLWAAAAEAAAQASSRRRRRQSSGIGRCLVVVVGAIVVVVG